MSMTDHGARLRWHCFALIVGWGLFALPVQADEPELKVLILELKSHVKQLTDRVSILEQALEQERSKREKAEAEMARVTSRPADVDQTEGARVCHG